jgi:hypothetical protein
MDEILNQTWYVMAAAASALAPGFLFLLWFRWRRRSGTASISRENLRGPGDYLREKLDRIDDRITGLIILLFLGPSVAVGFLLGSTLPLGLRPTQTNYLQLAVFLALFLPIPLFKFNRKLRERVRLIRSLVAELTVGRELNQLLREGYHVFHDFPAEVNNIDHVLAGPSGVFAVETTGRPKPDKDRVVVDAKVIYDGEALYFPDNAKEAVAVEQARRQAAALSQWLSGILDEPVQVQPTLALPGWFVERKKPDDLLLLYGQSSHYARILNGPAVLTDDKLKRIVEQLEARNRGVVVPELKDQESKK